MFYLIFSALLCLVTAGPVFASNSESTQFVGNASRFCDFEEKYLLSCDYSSARYNVIMKSINIGQTAKIKVKVFSAWKIDLYPTQDIVSVFLENTSNIYTKTDDSTDALYKYKLEMVSSNAQYLGEGADQIIIKNSTAEEVSGMDIQVLRVLEGSVLGSLALNIVPNTASSTMAPDLSSYFGYHISSVSAAGFTMHDSVVQNIKILKINGNATLEIKNSCVEIIDNLKFSGIGTAIISGTQLSQIMKEGIQVISGTIILERVTVERLQMDSIIVRSKFVIKDSIIYESTNNGIKLENGGTLEMVNVTINDNLPVFYIITNPISNVNGVYPLLFAGIDKNPSLATFILAVIFCTIGGLIIGIAVSYLCKYLRKTHSHDKPLQFKEQNSISNSGKMPTFAEPVIKAQNDQQEGSLDDLEIYEDVLNSTNTGNLPLPPPPPPPVIKNALPLLPETTQNTRNFQDLSHSEAAFQQRSSKSQPQNPNVPAKIKPIPPPKHAVTQQPTGPQFPKLPRPIFLKSNQNNFKLPGEISQKSVTVQDGNGDLDDYVEIDTCLDVSERNKI